MQKTFLVSGLNWLQKHFPTVKYTKVGERSELKTDGAERRIPARIWVLFWDGSRRKAVPLSATQSDGWFYVHGVEQVDDAGSCCATWDGGVNTL